MPGGCRFLKLHDFEPGIFSRRLVKMSVNTYIFWQAVSISILDIGSEKSFTVSIILTLRNSAHKYSDCNLA